MLPPESWIGSDSGAIATWWICMPNQSGRSCFAQFFLEQEVWPPSKNFAEKLTVCGFTHSVPFHS